MGATPKNQNAVKYNRKKVIKIMLKAITAVQKDNDLFNYPSLHTAIGLHFKRSLGYLVTKYQSDPEIMELWQKVIEGLTSNLKIHCEKKGWTCDPNNCFCKYNTTSLRAHAREGNNEKDVNYLPIITRVKGPDKRDTRARARGMNFLNYLNPYKEKTFENNKILQNERTRERKDK